MRKIEQNEHCCLECGSPLYGRIDKKFCDVQCRTSYHNRENRKDCKVMRSINSILKKNRSILKELYVNGKLKVRSGDLLVKGFIFRYFTHTQSKKESEQCYFVYEYGYIDLKNGFFTLVFNDETSTN